MGTQLMWSTFDIGDRLMCEDFGDIGDTSDGRVVASRSPVAKGIVSNVKVIQ
jgi:hypothetical protein